jgi:hypothetical protein
VGAFLVVLSHAGVLVLDPRETFFKGWYLFSQRATPSEPDFDM